ncbi:hypothetical protein WK26_11145 [Burkholderia vietnamiensis]|nr:hypothetical protein WK26_11145 [Burkholderia vietnamiensis]
MIPQLDGFHANQRVVATDVESKPPQRHTGTIVSLWSDRTAVVKWDYNLPFTADRHLVKNGHVELHYLNRQS